MQTDANNKKHQQKSTNINNNNKLPWYHLKHPGDPPTVAEVGNSLCSSNSSNNSRGLVPPIPRQTFSIQLLTCQMESDPLNIMIQIWPWLLPSQAQVLEEEVIVSQIISILLLLLPIPAWIVILQTTYFKGVQFFRNVKDFLNEITQLKISAEFEQFW